MAIAVEESGLHKRIALVALNTIGSSDRLLLLGFMIPTAFCSMWISNTATTAMMIPIIEAVLSEIEEKEDVSHDNQSVAAYGTFESTSRKSSAASAANKDSECASNYIDHNKELDTFPEKRRNTTSRLVDRKYCYEIQI